VWISELAACSRGYSRFIALQSRNKAAINIKYSEETLAACREMKLEFLHLTEPKNRKTQYCGLGHNRNQLKIRSVPKVIYDKGSPGKEPMICLLGTDAAEVANLLWNLQKITVKIRIKINRTFRYLQNIIRTERKILRIKLSVLATFPFSQSYFFQSCF